MSSHVLVPMDRSEPARYALEFALAQFEDADITALHVINPVEDTYFSSEEDFYTHFEMLEEESRQRAATILEDAEALAADHERQIHTEHAIGQPSKTIVEMCEDGPFTHVVIGSHGRGGVARLILGSVAEKVVRRAPVPVTVVKGDTDGTVPS